MRKRQAFRFDISIHRTWSRRSDQWIDHGEGDECKKEERYMGKIRNSIVAIICVLVFSLTACGSDAASSADSSGKVKNTKYR